MEGQKISDGNRDRLSIDCERLLNIKKLKNKYACFEWLKNKEKIIYNFIFTMSMLSRISRRSEWLGGNVRSPMSKARS